MFIRSGGHGDHAVKTEEAAPPATRSAGQFRIAAADVPNETVFGYMFFDLAGDASQRLPENASTVAGLRALGEAMITQPGTVDSDSEIPPVYTYWSQFIDHELTANTDRDRVIGDITGTNVTPVSPSTVEVKLTNRRLPRLELDAIYADQSNMTPEMRAIVLKLRDPANPAKMRIGKAGTSPGVVPPPLVGDANVDLQRDLPRLRQLSQDDIDDIKRIFNDPSLAEKSAFIGDNRNDENLIVAQFHLGVLRFHNAVVDYLVANGETATGDALYNKAKALTVMHYQWLVLNDFLKRVCMPNIVDRVVAEGAPQFKAFTDARAQRPLPQGFPAGALNGAAMPLEFSVAAYRFGHAMVRDAYDWNANFGRGEAPLVASPSLDLFFGFTGGGGRLDTTARLPSNWIAEWSRLTGIDSTTPNDGLPTRFARKIDTHLTPPLGRLVKEANDETNEELKKLLKHLARRNLLRGFTLSMPTGQAVHRQLLAQERVDCPVLTADQIAGQTAPLKQVISDYGFGDRTPLWFYILREAEIGGGNRLGEVGSRIVAETFVGLLKLDDDPVVVNGSWTPASADAVKLSGGRQINAISDFLEFAGVLARP